MTIIHLTQDEQASYYLGEAMRRKIAAGTRGYGPLGTEIGLIRQWAVRWLAASELAVVEITIPEIKPYDLFLEDPNEPTRPKVGRTF